MQITNAKDYLKRPYARVIVQENEGGFYTEILEFRGCYSSGETREEALDNLEEAAELWLEAEIEDGHNIPEPFSEQEYSGKFPLRMPKDLHKQVASLAYRQGTSLNQYIVAAIAARTGADDLGNRITDKIIQRQFVFNIVDFKVASTEPDVYVGGEEPLRISKFQKSNSLRVVASTGEQFYPNLLGGK